MLSFSVETGEFAANILRVREELASLQSGTLAARLVVNVGKLDAQQHEQDFAAEGGRSGSRWAQLSEPYRTWKRKAVGAKKILVFDGKLRKALTVATNRDRISRTAGTAIEVGTRHWLARFHQSGTTRMPARPVVRKSPRQAEALKVAYDREIVLRCAEVTTGNVSRTFRISAAALRPDPRA